MHNYNVVIPLVVGFMFMALSGPVDAIKTYNEAQLKIGKGGFKRLTDKEIGHLYINRTLLLRHKKATEVKIWNFYHQNGKQYLKILGNKKYEGKIFETNYEIKDDRIYYESIVNGDRYNDRVYGNNEIVWRCGGRSKKCSYYTKILKESWDGDSKNLKK